MKRFAARFAAILMVGFAGTGYATAQEEDVQQLYQEFMEINMRLQQVQEEAMEDENVAVEAESYSNLISKKIKEIDTEAGAMVDRREEMITKFDEAQGNGDVETMQNLEKEYTELNTKLQPFLQRVMEDEEVVARKDKFEAILIAKMGEIEPETDKLFARINELGRILEKYYN